MGLWLGTFDGSSVGTLIHWEGGREISDGAAVVRCNRILIALALAGLLAGTGEVKAQLFGDRSQGRGTPTPGRPLFGGRRGFGVAEGAGTQRSSGRAKAATSPSPFEGVGTLDLNARYVRGNREAADFVGADSGDEAGFVGARHAESVEDVRSAVEGLRIERGAPDANRTQLPPTRRRAVMYRPRLRVGFQVERPAAETVNSNLIDRLELSLAPSETGRIEVLVEGGTATLRGEVPSHRQRRLARLLLLLEPGISEVENELTVTASPPTSRASGSPDPVRRPEDQP